MKKPIIKDLLAVLAAALISLVLELVVCQWGAFVNHKYEQELSFRDAVITSQEGQTSYTFALDGDYVRYGYLYFNGKENVTFQITGRAVNGYDQEVEFTTVDEGAAYLGRSAVRIEQYMKELTITMDSERADELQQVAVANKLFFFTARFLLFFCGLLLLHVFNSHKEFCRERPDLTYFFAAMALGVVMMLSSHYALDSWDEQIHLNNVYVQSHPGRSVTYTDSAMSNVELRVPVANTQEEERWIGDWLNEHNQELVLRNPKGLLINYNQFAYLPMSAGMLIGRIFQLPYTWTFYLSKFLNLFFCAGVVAQGIRYCRYGKRILMGLGLVPTAIFQFSCFSYDGFVLALTMTGLALFMTEFMSQEKQDWRRVMASVIAITVGCFSKAVYIPLLAIYWVMPGEKFCCKKQERAFKILIGVVILLVLATFVIPVLSGVAGGAEVAGDYRGGNTSQSGQLGMIFSHPWTYTGVLLGSMNRTVANFFIGPDVMCNFAYRGIYRGLGFFMVSFTLLFAYLQDYNLEEEDANIMIASRGRKRMMQMKLWMGFLTFGTMCLIWTALYLDFTPVGSLSINGVSPRYYLPLLLPFSFLFINRKLNCKMVKESYQKWITMLMYIGCGITIYNQFMM